MGPGPKAGNQTSNICASSGGHVRFNGARPEGRESAVRPSLARRASACFNGARPEGRESAATLPLTPAPCRPASMGPGPKAGNQNEDIRLVRIEGELQWGPARRPGIRAWPPKTQSASTCFNGARPEGRESEPSRSASARYRQASMGPGPKAGNQADATSSSTHCLWMLQWGPARRPGIRVQRDTGTQSSSRSFNGARPEGRESAPL